MVKFRFPKRESRSVSIDFHDTYDFLDGLVFPDVRRVEEAFAVAALEEDDAHWSAGGLIVVVEE